MTIAALEGRAIRPLATTRLNETLPTNRTKQRSICRSISEIKWSVICGPHYASDPALVEQKRNPEIGRKEMKRVKGPQGAKLRE